MKTTKATSGHTLSAIKTFMLALALVMGFAVSATAQQADGTKGTRQRMSREQLAEKQAQHIAKAVALDEELTKKFVDTYSDCQKEIWALGPRQKGADGIEQRFERSRKVLDIREKYYKKYKKFLSNEQIQKVYDEERRMMSHMAQGKKNRQGKGNRPERKKQQD